MPIVSVGAVSLPSRRVLLLRELCGLPLKLLLTNDAQMVVFSSAYSSAEDMRCTAEPLGVKSVVLSGLAGGSSGLTATSILP